MHIFDFKSEKEFADFITSFGFPKFRAKQVFDWVYDKFVLDLDKMKNLPKDLCEFLENNVNWELPRCVKESVATDKTSKVLFDYGNGNFIESVLIPSDSRMTLCVSTQVGCKMGCLFCATGKMGFVRNLFSWEIIAQIFWAAEFCKANGKRLSNLVYMGMGEPLDNYESVLQSVRSAKDFFGLGAKRVVISTCGLPRGIEQLSVDEPNLKLAVSLHSAVEIVRNQLMPISKSHSLAELKNSLLNFSKKSPFKITFEYILLPEINMDRKSVKALFSYLGDLPAKVNFIPYNSVEGVGFASPTKREIESFCRYFEHAPFPYTIRNSMGNKVQAACGQLAGKRNK